MSCVLFIKAFPRETVWDDSVDAVKASPDADINRFISPGVHAQFNDSLRRLHIRTDKHFLTGLVNRVRLSVTSVSLGVTTRISLLGTSQTHGDSVVDKR